MIDAPFSVSLNIVRFDKRLSPMARLFYGEICGGLTINHGCRIDDSYYAWLYGITDRQVRNLRKELIEYDYTYEKEDVDGIRYIFPKQDAERQIKDFKKARYVNTEEIVYKTAEGKILKTSTEAKMYFKAVVSATTNVTTVQEPVLKFLNAFSNCMFDSFYFHKRFGNKTQEVTKEFFEYVLQNFTVEEIYPKATYIFGSSHFVQIVNFELYVLAVLVQMFGEEFKSKSKQLFMKEKRQKSKDAEIKRKELELEIYNRQQDGKNRELLKEGKKEISKEMEGKKHE